MRIFQSDCNEKIKPFDLVFKKIWKVQISKESVGFCNNLIVFDNRIQIMLYFFLIRICNRITNMILIKILPVHMRECVFIFSFFQDKTTGKKIKRFWFYWKRREFSMEVQPGRLCIECSKTVLLHSEINNGLAICILALVGLLFLLICFFGITNPTGATANFLARVIMHNALFIIFLAVLIIYNTWFRKI